jgi:hypothetical protein
LVTHIEAYNRGDVNAFHIWADCWERWGRKMYVACEPSERPYYPAIGTAISAGAVHLITSILGITERDTSAIIFRYYLAFFDAINFLLLIWLGSLMRFQFPVFIAIIILITPSTWVGSSIWGQIDGISLFLCLISLVLFVKSWLAINVGTASQKAWKSGLYLLLGSLSISLYLLTKQSAIFSLPFFFLIFLVTAWKFWDNYHYKGIIWLALAAIISISFLRYVDSSFVTPEHFHNSSYWFIWQGISGTHTDKISGNGLNIWMFLGRNMWSSSKVPFFTLNLGSWQYAMTPYKTGIILYLILIIFLLFSGCKSIGKILKSKIWDEQRDKAVSYLVALLCFFHGLSYLGFNVLLSGTHERYLYLGYPFLLIAVAWFYSNKIVFSWRLTTFCFFAAAAYGCFVFRVIGRLPQLLFPFQRHEFLAALHLFLLVLLLDAWVQVCQFKIMHNSLER